MSQYLQHPACISFTGDVDTAGAIALAAGSWCIEIYQDLPNAPIDGLENTPYGRGYLIKLNEKLINTFN